MLGLKYILALLGCCSERWPYLKSREAAVPLASKHASPQMLFAPQPTILHPCDAPQSTVDLLRKAARESPTVRFKVLVTGSLYMVGDVLKMLGVCAR